MVHHVKTLEPEDLVSCDFSHEAVRVDVLCHGARWVDSLGKDSLRKIQLQERYDNGFYTRNSCKAHARTKKTERRIIYI